MVAGLCRCGHLKGTHVLDGCRINGCRCQGFNDGTMPDEPETAPRRLVIDIPEGYFASVSVYPMASEDVDGS